MDSEGEASATAGDVTDHISDSTNRSNMVLGAGVQYDVSDRFGIQFEWDRYFDVGSEEIVCESDIDLFALGLRYNFD